MEACAACECANILIFALRLNSRGASDEKGAYV